MSVATDPKPGEMTRLVLRIAELKEDGRAFAHNEEPVRQVLVYFSIPAKKLFQMFKKFTQLSYAVPNYRGNDSVFAEPDMPLCQVDLCYLNTEDNRLYEKCDGVSRHLHVKGLGNLMIPKYRPYSFIHDVSHIADTDDFHIRAITMKEPCEIIWEHGKDDSL